MEIEIESAVKGIDGVTDVNRSIQEGIPQENIHIAREKVADLGLSVRDVTRLIETAIAGLLASSLITLFLVPAAYSLLHHGGAENPESL